MRRFRDALRYITLFFTTFCTCSLNPFSSDTKCPDPYAHTLGVSRHDIVADRGERIDIEAHVQKNRSAAVEEFVWRINDTTTTVTVIPHLDTMFARAGVYTIVASARTHTGDVAGADTISVKVFTDLIEYDYCWRALKKHFLYREDLPDDPYRFDSPAALFESLGNRYTDYIPPQYNTAFFRSMTTRIDTGHCGVTVDSAKTGYVVTDVIDHSPAHYSEIKTGDTLLVIEGESCEGVTALRMQQLLKGAQGTTKTIRLARKDSILTRKLLMDTFFWPSVFYDSLSETTARIRIETFAYNTEHDSGTFGEFYHALDTAAWASNIIIDLRGNRGGYLWQCFKTLEPFVSSGNPFIRFRIWEFDTTTFTGEAIDTLIRATDPRWANAQCYMLVDSSTASASELFVAALRENRTNALTIGSSTFGKASGWTYAETPRSAIATITTLSITPVHEPSYDSVGIRPDIVIGEDEDALQVALSRIGVSAAAKRLAHSQRALRPVGAPAHAGPDGLIVEPMFFSR